MRTLGILGTALAAGSLVLGLHASAYAATITGTSGNDVLHGTSGADTIKARAGDDTVYGGPGADTIFGDRGRDTLYGGRGADEIVDATSPGRDHLYGGPGNDRIIANYRDQVRAGSGDDHVYAYYTSPGMRIDCGKGRDVLVFNDPHPGVTVVGCEKVRVISAG